MGQDDGPGDELGEEGHEEGVLHEPVAAAPPVVGVHEVGDLLEGEERDPDGQGDGPEGDAGPRHGVHRVDEEVRVLEPSQEGEVEGQARHEDEAAPGRARGGLDAPAEQEVHQDGGGEEQEVDGVPPAVEDEGGPHEPAQGRASAARAGEEGVSRKHHGQEEEDEDVGVEEHPGSRGAERSPVAEAGPSDPIGCRDPGGAARSGGAVRGRRQPGQGARCGRPRRLVAALRSSPCGPRG